MCWWVAGILFVFVSHLKLLYIFNLSVNYMRGNSKFYAFYYNNDDVNITVFFSWTLTPQISTIKCPSSLQALPRSFRNQRLIVCCGFGWWNRRLGRLAFSCRRVKHFENSLNPSGQQNSAKHFLPSNHGPLYLQNKRTKRSEETESKDWWTNP